MPGYLDTQVFPAVIPAGQALSAPVAIGSKLLVGIAMPASWTAAGVSFQVSVDGGTTWLELETVTGAFVLTTGANQYVGIDPEQFHGVSMITVRSGTLSSPVNQSAGATIGLVTRTILP